jgi:hypothetical protein
MKKREIIQQIAGIAASIENIVEISDGTADDSRMRLTVIKADARRIRNLAAMIRSTSKGSSHD